VPYVPRQKFYFTEDERKWAEAERRKIGAEGKFVVLIALAGSSMHKTYPHMDSVIASFLADEIFAESVHFVTVGDALCQILDAGWVNEPRVSRMTDGQWTMRQTFVFACTQADFVLGPETGVLNAVAFEKVPKGIFLSHSSVTNLTRDWVNVYNFLPKGVDCHPCHLMQFPGRGTCNFHPETGAAMCAQRTNPNMVVEAIAREMTSWMLEKAA